MNKIKKLIVGVFFVFAVCAIVSCDGDEKDLPMRNYKLVWQDEFDGSELDATKWNYDLGAGGWGNNELQTYTNDERNIAVKNGVLEITALNDGGYTSARINTKDLFEQTYGRFEARIKMPYGKGIWPAFWMLGANYDEDGWPQCGEIDIMEYRGQEPTKIHGSMHGVGYSGGSPITDTYELINSRFDVDYHIFAVEWGKDYVDYYVDEVLYQRITPSDLPTAWLFDHNFFIILNMAVGGDYVGSPTSSTPFPQTMYVDYVRVYKEI